MENKNIFEKGDQLSSELDELMGGVKVTITITRPDGTTYELAVEW